MHLKNFLSLALITVSSIYSASSVASLDAQFKPEITTEIVTAIAGKSAGFISKISLGGKEWNVFKIDDPSIHGGDLDSQLRLEISTDLSKIQNASNRSNGTYTILIRQPIPNREIFRIINFEVNGARVDFKAQLGLIEFASDEHTQQQRVHESSEREHTHSASTHVSQVSELAPLSPAPGLSDHLAALINQGNVK